jgi:hypothetical protein
MAVCHRQVTQAQFPGRRTGSKITQALTGATRSAPCVRRAIGPEQPNPHGGVVGGYVYKRPSYQNLLQAGLAMNGIFEVLGKNKKYIEFRA